MKPALTFALSQKLCAILWLCTAFQISLSQETTQTPAQPTTQTPEKPPALLSSHNQAALNLYTQLSKEQEGQNLFFSPMSAHTVLWLCYAGSSDKTADEIAQTLHLEQSPAEIPEAYQDFAKILSRPAPKPQKAAPQLHKANALIQVSPDFTINPAFLKTAQNSFKSEFFNCDLKGINHWVSKQTQGKIPRIFNQLPENSALILLNAIYFEGDWQQPFPRNTTRPRPFYEAKGKSEKVNMMFQSGEFKLHESEEFQLLRLPYKNSHLSMCVLLPNPKLTTLAKLESSLNAQSLQQLQTQLQAQKPETVEVYLPRLKLNSNINLARSYQDLGIKRAFVPGLADFQNLGEHKNLGGEWTYISHILQKAVLEVDEEGTVAVVVTGGIADVFGGPPKPKIFNANHPFLFWIQDDETGALLFLGRYQKPMKS